MVYGTVPFRGRTEQELRVNIERGLIRYPADVSISQELKDFIAKSLLNDSLKRIGVKEMERHAWMLSITSKRHSETTNDSSPGKIEE
jgi:serine/threonine protein kinase